MNYISTIGVHQALFDAIVKVAPEWPVDHFQDIFNKGHDPDVISQLDPEMIALGAAWYHAAIMAKMGE